jgi:hypothetical protein
MCRKSAGWCELAEDYNASLILWETVPIFAIHGFREARLRNGEIGFFALNGLPSQPEVTELLHVCGFVLAD